MFVRSYCLLSLFLLSSSFLFAQEVREHEKVMFRSEEGSLYVNLHEPMYLHLSSSPDPAASSQRLESKETKRYADPFYFDAEGYNSIRTPWAVDPESREIIYPPQDVVFEVYADGTPPVTRVEYEQANLKRVKGKLVSGGKTILSLRASDAISGVKEVYYSLDDKPFVVYQDALTLDQEKRYTIRYYALDKVGNVEPVQTLEIEIDLSDPVTTYKLEGDVHEGVVSARTRLVLEASDPAGIKATYIQINDGARRKYTGPVPLGTLPEGKHQLVYYSEDLIGNVEKADTLVLFVDKTSPVLLEELLGNRYMVNGKEFSSGRSRMKLTAFDNKAGVKDIFYSINQGEYQRYTEPFFLNQSEGSIQIDAYAVDHVNNKSEKSAEETAVKEALPYIDLSGPQLSALFSGPHKRIGDIHYITAQTKITLLGKDGESGMSHITYNLSDSAMLKYQEPFSLEEEKEYTIGFTGYDAVDNSASETLICRVDQTGPVISIHYSTSPIDRVSHEGSMLDQYPAQVVLFLSARDEEAGFSYMEYQVGNSPLTKYQGEITNLKKGKAHFIKVTGYDQLGNQGQESFELFVAD